MKYKLTEKQLKFAIADFMKLQYPHILFRIDYDQNALTAGKRVQICRLKSNNSAWPDIFIAQPSQIFHGLFVEVKSSKEKIYKKGGELRTDKHLQEQITCMNLLKKLGYCTSFTWSIDHFQEIIRLYLNQ